MKDVVPICQQRNKSQGREKLMFLAEDIYIIKG
jgi:hypothetical protein